MKVGDLVRSNRNPLYLGRVLRVHGTHVTVQAVDGTEFDCPGFECVRPGAEEIVPVEHLRLTCPADPACDLAGDCEYCPAAECGEERYDKVLRELRGDPADLEPEYEGFGCGWH